VSILDIFSSHGVVLWRFGAATITVVHPRSGLNMLVL